MSRRLTNLAGSEPPSTSFFSSTGDENIVEELTVRDFKNSNLALVSHPLSSRQSHRNQSGNESRYMNLSTEIVPQDEEQLPIRLNKEIKGNDSDFWSMDFLSCKKTSYEPEKGSANKSIGDKTITSSNAHFTSTAMHNTSSTYNFSPLVVKQKLKGKGVICKDAADVSMEPRGALISRKDETPTFATKFHSDTLLTSNVAGDDKPYFKKFVMSGAESSHDGINLREWLNPSGHKINKNERLHIFKQILDFVDSAHCKGVVLQDLRPSCFTLLPSSKVKYIGSFCQGELYNVSKKRPLQEDIDACLHLGAKQQKLCKEIRSLGKQHHFTCIPGCWTKSVNCIDSYTIGPMDSRTTKSMHQNSFSYQHTSNDEQQFMAITVQLEEKWYSSPEELNDGGCTFSSNIYNLGVLLFEVWKYC